MDFNLESRLIDYVSSISEIINKLEENMSSTILSNQLFRSASSSALNYAEAMGGESRKDFIHKMKIVLKELRETYMSLSIIIHAEILKKKTNIEDTKKENNELISIFVKSIETARRNMQNK